MQLPIYEINCLGYRDVNGEGEPSPEARRPGRAVQRVLIANRGEIALRAARACRAVGLESVAVYSEADAASPHRWVADAAWCVGPAPSTASYLNSPALLHVAKASGCDAVYPGYGFLAENADFAGRCAAEGLAFIGPRPETIRLMGDKARARAAAEQAGVPIVPGSQTAFDGLDEARGAAEAIGFPLLLKARSGGGGRGMRVADDRTAFERLFEQARGEAEAAFGDGAIYLERFLARVRHIEVQLFGDSGGRVVQLGERDCTVQRRHQKLVEEAPSPALDAETRVALLDAAVRLGRSVGYEGAGTVEFVYEPESRAFYFIEMNTRIQVEHPVTEALTGLDLVALQLRVARGEALGEHLDGAAAQGHAIEFRINAENWRNGFTPSPGRLARWRPPAGEGVRLDSHVYEGYLVPPFYDSMIGKLIVSGADRADALSRAERAIGAFACDGIATTLGFHQALLADPAFRDGGIHTRWVEAEFLADEREDDRWDGPSS